MAEGKAHRAVEDAPPFDGDIHLCTKKPSADESLLIEQLRSQLRSQHSKHYSEFEQWLSDDMLQRFLIARQYNLQKASKMLVQAMDWRAARNPGRFFPRVTLEDEARFEHEMATGKIYISGVDKWGRVVIVFNNQVQNTKSHEDQMDFLCWQLEVATRLLPRGIDKYVIFNHLEGFSLFTCPSMKTTRETVMMLTTAYPERLGHMVCYQAPSYFHVVFNGLSAFIDKRTVSKLLFVSGSCKDGSENDVYMRQVIGGNWKQLCGVEQPQYAPKSSPGFERAAVWAQHREYIDRVERAEKADKAEKGGDRARELTVQVEGEGGAVMAVTVAASVSVSVGGSTSPPASPAPGIGPKKFVSFGDLPVLSDLTTASSGNASPRSPRPPSLTMTKSSSSSSSARAGPSTSSATSSSTASAAMSTSSASSPAHRIPYTAMAFSVGVGAAVGTALALRAAAWGECCVVSVVVAVLVLALWSTETETEPPSPSVC